jgi:hypothetical protein
MFWNTIFQSYSAGVKQNESDKISNSLLLKLNLNLSKNFWVHSKQRTFLLEY